MRKGFILTLLCVFIGVLSSPAFAAEDSSGDPVAFDLQKQSDHVFESMLEEDDDGFDDDDFESWDDEIPEWRKNSDGWRYLLNGKPLTGLQMLPSRDKSYYDDNDKFIIVEAMFYFNESGIMQTGWQNVEGQMRYFDPEYGDGATGATEIGKRFYFFGDDGAIATGWQTTKVTDWEYPFIITRYVNEDGTIVAGFKEIDGNHYYFANDKYDYYFNEKGDDYRTICVYGAMADCGKYKNYVISYDGKCYKIPTKKEDKSCNKIAKLIAKCAGKGVKGMTDLDKVSRAAFIVGSFSAQAKYTMKGKYYNKPYGVFYAKRYSCAGSTRALGLVLKKMGFKWKHVNANKYKHQWCKLKMDGKKGWADGQLGAAGYGKHPAQ